ncbi:MAG: hypothetical protein GWO24_35700, partial [Akkermansiaceae bacterium]|nr:hypothetical protein [Akkermansiaceae bacterium]
MRIRRGHEIIEATDEEILEKDDHISLIGSLANLNEAGETLGPEILDPELLNYNVMTKEVIVIDRDIVGRSLGDLNIPGNYGCFVRGLTR